MVIAIASAAAVFEPARRANCEQERGAACASQKDLLRFTHPQGNLWAIRAVAAGMQKGRELRIGVRAVAP